MQVLPLPPAIGRQLRRFRGRRHTLRQKESQRERGDVQSRANSCRQGGAVDFIVATVESADAGAASGVIGTMQRVGSAIGIAAFTRAYVLWPRALAVRLMWCASGSAAGDDGDRRHRGTTAAVRVDNTSATVINGYRDLSALLAAAGNWESLAKHATAREAEVALVIGNRAYRARAKEGHNTASPNASCHRSR